MTDLLSQWLSKLNLVFFTPCLLFSNIASVISFEKLLAYWPIPIFYSIFALISFSAAHGISRAVRVKPVYRRFIVACTMFSNTNSLPVAVISSLALSEAGQILYWGDNDSQQAVAARYVSPHQHTKPLLPPLCIQTLFFIGKDFD